MKVKLLCALSLISVNALALTSTNFKEDDTIEISLSKNEYNRVYVVNDKIKGAHFSDKNIAIQNEADGSVYIDLLQDLPTTVFFDTQKGHHFAALIKPLDALGQTVKITANSASPRAKVVEKDAGYEQMITNIVKAMKTNTIPEGYGLNKSHSSYKNLGFGLRKKTAQTLVGDGFIGETVEIYNASKKSIQLNEKWFANKDTRAVSLSQNALLPKHSAQVYVVKEKAHG
jgi:conjugal transfer pilus assembly protein TraK